MSDPLKQSQAQELEQLRTGYNKIIEEQRAKCRELEKALEKERELRVKESISIDQELAKRLQQNEQLFKEKYDKMMEQLDAKQLEITNKGKELADKEIQLQSDTKFEEQKRQQLEYDLNEKFRKLQQEYIFYNCAI
jgi:hypothetical protein